jgi:hypothetical protein
MKLVCVALALLAGLPQPVRAQEEKAEIQVFNNRHEPITMRFSYAFREYTWKLMDHRIDVGTDITYRFPSNIPGCEKLHEWGIADGVLAISNDAGTLCQRRVSLCDKTVSIMQVSDTQCAWRQVGAATP